MASKRDAAEADISQACQAPSSGPHKKVYYCERCQIECKTAKMYRAHLAGKKHNSLAKPSWPHDFRRLSCLPQRATTLCEHAMLANLDHHQAAHAN